MLLRNSTSAKPVYKKVKGWGMHAQEAFHCKVHCYATSLTDKICEVLLNPVLTHETLVFLFQPCDLFYQRLHILF